MTLVTAKPASSVQEATRRATEAGLAYAAGAFAVGFVLGTIRVLVVVPVLGELVGVSLELPIMLAVSWPICRRATAHFAVPARVSARLVMGAVAFAGLMAAETALSLFVFGRSLSEHLLRYREWASLLGLAGQIAFAAFPTVQACASSSADRCAA
jgi:hypothetical protein